MCSMCNDCGAELNNSEDGRKVENQKSVELNNGGHLAACKHCWEKQERESLKRDVFSPYATPLISPTTSLSSSDRSFSSCSEFSVDGMSYDRGNQEEGTTDSSQEDLSYRMNGRLQNSSSRCTENRIERSNTTIENNNNGNGGDTLREVEIMQNTNFQETKENGIDKPSGSSVEGHGSSRLDDDLMDPQIWEPPEPEDSEDDMEDSVAFNDDDDDDDDDEYGDGTKWGKPSSLSLRSCRFKEEKERATGEVINGKFKAIVSQLLKSAGVAASVNDDENWVDIVTSLSWEAASFLKLDADDGKRMDPDGYVKVKCIATGSPSQSQVVKGLVFKKHAAHKHMPTKYKNPRLLLIRGVLGQSSSGLSSFHSMEQEKDHLKSVIEMIEMCHPNVVLVEKTASRDVQESILAKGITLVFDMKLHRLERVARCTGSQIVSSDTLMNQKLKKCDSFHIEKFVEEHAAFGEGGKQPTKTLMFLEGCATHLGCTILLKGSHSYELKRVKYVVQCAVVMAYHLILETAFLVDQKAMFSTIPFTGLAEVMPIDQGNHALESATALGLDESTAESGLSAIDIPVSNGFYEEDSHVSVGSECDKIVNGVPNGDSALSYEPYNPAIFTGLSSLSASLKKVIWNSFPITSATSQSLSACLSSNGGEANGHLPEAVPASKISEVSYQCEVEEKGGSDEEKSFNDGQPESSSVCTDIIIDDGNKENQLQNKEDVNTLLDSQSILVLMSRRNFIRGTICEQSHFSHIKFYKNFDVPLGKFLRDNLLNQKTQCMTCGELPEAHFYYYAHKNTQLMIQVKRLPVEKHLPGEAGKKLWMWSSCRKCRSMNRASKSTKRVLISTAARGLSFGKFLELSFSQHSSSRRLFNCGHSLDRDFLYFFGLGPMVAMFRYSHVTTYTVSMPPQMLEFTNSIRLDWLEEEFKNVCTKGNSFFLEVAESLKQMRSKFIGSTLILQGLQKDFSDIEEMLKEESSEFQVNLQNAVGKNNHADVTFYKLLSLNRLRWELLLESYIWVDRLHSLLVPSPAAVVTDVSERIGLEQCSSKLNGSVRTGNSGRGSNLENGHADSDNGSNLKISPDTTAGVNEFSVKEIPVDGPLHDSEERDDWYNTSNVTEDRESQATGVLSSDASTFSGSHHPTDSCPRDNFPPSHQQVGRILPIVAEPANNDSPPSNGCLWMPFREIRQIPMKDLQRAYLPKFESVSGYAAEHLPIAYQLISEEGSRLHIPLGDDNYIVSDYEGELSSIIACALALLKDPPASAEVVKDDSMEENGMASKTIQRVHSLPRIPTVLSPHLSLNGSSDSDSLQHTVSFSSDQPRFSSFDGLNLLDSFSPPEGHNIEVSLGMAKSLGKSKYSVVCLYANQFRNLRNLCCPSELDYIASLCRCKNWDAKGGKSKSFFAKTLDDRLIIKEIKKTEYDSFEKFAPQYFKYMNESFELGNQTCLAKVLGIYQVIIRQSRSGKEIRHDLMVMENLSFGRNITRQYDLKGALHARFNSAADGSGDVLLDQNFVNDMNCSPLYVSNSAKRILQRAVWNDTTFLNLSNVMDYSLLVGVDAERRELVCGIIDYLRQYTWDKQLETWVKSSLVVPKNVLPTVISPKEYKKRFRKFMSTYFLSVPDNWCSGSPEPCELCGIRDDKLSQSKSQKQGIANGFSP